MTMLSENQKVGHQAANVERGAWCRVRGVERSVSLSAGAIWPRAAVLSLLFCTACGSDEPAATSCGDGFIEQGEACDDGNNNAGDGCSDACALESGYNCQLEGLPCTTVCGDSIRAGAEECDDGNLTPGDGCSATCRTEAPVPVEICNDGADNDGDGLTDCADADCAAECAVPEVCGDSVDNDADGLTDCADPDCNGDPSCTPVVENCEVPGDEDGNSLADCADPVCSCDCGNGRVEGDEQCDEGELNSDELEDACRTTCVAASCGDGVVDSDEACDGNDVPVGLRCEACALVGDGVCGEAVSLGRWELETNATAAWSRTFVVDSGFADDVALPSECAPVQGRDGVAVIRAAETMQVEFTITVPGDEGFAAANLASSCEPIPGAWCARASATRPARRVMQLVAGAEYYLTLDTAGQRNTQVSVTVRRISAVVGIDEPCGLLPDTSGCGNGLDCVVDGRTGELFCETGVTPPSGPGGPCQTADDCLTGLVCDETCVAVVETTCDSELELSDFENEDESESLLALLPTSGSPTGTCAGLPRSAVLRVSPSPEELVVVTARSVTGLPVALSRRENCAQASSEQACVVSIPGQTATLSFFPAGDDEAVVVVEGFGDVQVKVERFPVVGSGGACDPLRESNRCGPGLDCISGTCRTAVAGSCADPAPGFISGTGELTGRGFVVDAALSTVEPQDVSGCAGARRTQVFVFDMPASGELSVELADVSLAALVALTRDCRLLGASELCPARPSSGAVLQVSAGERVEVVVSAESDLEVSLVVRLRVQQPEGGPCTDGADCRTGLQCRGAVCQRRAVTAGELCNPVTDVCPASAVCAPLSGELRCRPTVAEVGEECGGLSGLPSCPAGVTCVAESTGVSFCRDLGGVQGEACDAVRPCSTRLTCVEGACWPAPAAEGGTCETESPRPCQEGLVCRAGAGTGVCVPEGVTSCSEVSPCGAGQVCVAGACELPLAEGAACTIGSGIPCLSPLECTAGGSGSTCVRPLLGVGSSCNTSAQCQSGLFCQPVGGGSARQCATRRTAGQVCVFGGPEDQCVDGLTCGFDSSFTPRCQ